MKRLHIKKGDRFEDNAISISPDNLTQVFDNIVSNACKYGFTDPQRQDYTIRIEVKSIEVNGKPMVSITVSNNGSALAMGMDKSKFFHWGVGQGTGLGTWQVKNIIEHSHGSVALNEYPNDPLGFEIEYEILLPQVNVW